MFGKLRRPEKPCVIIDNFGITLQTTIVYLTSEEPDWSPPKQIGDNLFIHWEKATFFVSFFETDRQRKEY